METLTMKVMSNTKKMPTTDFIKLDEVFCQRNTQARVHRTAKRLKENPLPTHEAVVLGRYPNEKLVVLDGNTRALAWKLGLAPMPAYVNATIYRVKDDDEARKLYESLDSEDAVERSSDKVWSAMQIVYGEAFDYFHSTVITKGKLTSALRHALRFVKDGRKQRGNVNWKKDISNIVDALNYFKWEIVKLDHFMQNDNGYHNRTTQAQNMVILLLLKKYGLNNQRLNSGIRRWVENDHTPVETSATGNKIDMITWMVKHLMQDTAYAYSRGSGQEHMNIQLDYHLAFLEGWMEGKLMADNPHAKKPQFYGTKERWCEETELPALQSANLM